MLVSPFWLNFAEGMLISPCVHPGREGAAHALGTLPRKIYVNDKTMDISNLLRAVQEACGYSFSSSRDFDNLSEKIMLRTRERISPTTLKRMFGYLKEEVAPRAFTLDVLAQFVGYKNYEAFCQDFNKGEKVQSNVVLSQKLSADCLAVGQRVRLTWKPDRVCIIEYRGEGLWTVVEAQQTKLCAGDTFRCHLFIAHEPLFLDELRHGAGQPVSYVAGRKDGIMFELV